METSPRLDELNHLYERLSAQERDDLLQCLFIAAPRGGDAMIKGLEDEPLCHAAEEMREGPLEGDEADRWPRGLA